MKQIKDKIRFSKFALFPVLEWKVSKAKAYAIFLSVLVLSFVSCKTRPKASTVSAKQSETFKSSGASDQKQLSGKERVEFEYLFFNSNREKILGNYDLAELSLIQALRIYPGSAATMYELANIYAFKNSKKQSLFYSKKAALSDPANIWYQLLYIDCLKENKQASEILTVYQKLIKRYPERVDFYYELANAYLYANKTAEAIKTYDKIEGLTGISEDASMQKFKIYKATNNFEKALEEIQKLIIAFPKEGKYYGILGELYQDKGQSEKALVAYKELLKVDPQNAHVHLSLADYYRSQKENDKAFEEIKIAFKSEDLNIDTKIKILLSYYSITETHTELRDDADELCRIIVDVHSDDAKAFSMYGDFLFRDKKLPEARAQFRKAIAIDKGKYMLWNQLLIIEFT